MLERIDRLPEAKLAAQIGAVIGRSFTYELIRVVAEMPEAALRTNLKQLVSAGLVFERGVPPEASFTFKHALVQDVAYESLLRGRRAALHARVADALCTRRPWSTECQPELLNSRIADAVSPRPEVEPEVIAYHLTEAGRTREAVSHWLLAGQRAAGRSAEREAVSLLRRGLTALDTLPESDERDRQELAFQMALGMPLVATERYGTDVVGSVFERARILSRRLGDAQSQLIATYGAFVNNIARGDHRAAAQISEQATDQFASEDNPTCRLILHRMAGFTAFQAGMFREARRKMEAVLALYDLEVHRPLAGRWIDARVATLDHLTLVLWLLGYPDQAYRRMEEAFEAASRVSHAGSIGHVHFFAGVLFADMRRDPIALQQRSAAAVAFAREHGQIGSGREFFRGLALLECGVQAEGLALAEQSLERMERFGLEERPYLLCRLSATYAHLGHIEKAWDTIVQAQLVAERTADHIWDAEVDRVAGTVLLAKGASALEVEARFRKAIDLARQQDAKSLELRAAIDLARLWIGQGKGADARMMLVPIHAWFTEGFDTPDLREAAALLAELGGTQV